VSAREDIATKLWWAMPSTDIGGATARTEQHLDAYRAEVLHEAAAWFERQCPEAGGAFELCMCHAAGPLRDLAGIADGGEAS
jgi:hypothetical protein